MPRKKVAFDMITILYQRGATGLPKGPVKLLDEDDENLVVQEVKSTGRVKVKVATKTWRIPKSLVKAICEEEVTVDGESVETKTDPAKRRGRPPKSATAKTPAKRRGRPPKSESGKAPAKRRGRPPKKDGAKKTVAKKRGRPKKNAAAKKVAKKRGRPKGSVGKKKVAKKKVAKRKTRATTASEAPRRKRRVKRVSDDTGRKRKGRKGKKRRGHIDLLGSPL